MNNSQIDTSFRTALARLARNNRIVAYEDTVDPHLELSALMKAMDGREAVFFPRVAGFDIPVLGNLLCCRENYEAAFGTDIFNLRNLISRAFRGSLEPALVAQAPWQKNVVTENIDVGARLPALVHLPHDNGRYITAGIVIVRDPETGVYNASYHRLKLVNANTLAIKMDYGRHLRTAFEHAKQVGKPLPIAICLGTDLSLYLTAATMGSKMPLASDELAAAGSLKGSPLQVVKAMTQVLVVPVDTEIVLEGTISITETTDEAPFGEFIGSYAPPAPAPTVHLTCLSHRDQPIYHAINGFGRETIGLRKYVLETTLLEVLQAAVPIVTDVDMSSGGLHRFHAVVQVKKAKSQDDGLQRNAILAAFGALKDLDLVTVVDDDIDIRDPADVEYALATRMNAADDLIVVEGARSHEYIRVSNGGIRGKLGIDATVPFATQATFRRAEFRDVQALTSKFTARPESVAQALSQSCAVKLG
jgi:2,5-furandicarboxylate decarboxylase 1